MRKLILILPLIILFIASCSEDVNIKSDFTEQYILNCILSADTNFQVAYLSKSFDVEGYDVEAYEGNPFIKNAEIVLHDNGESYFFSESEIESLPGFEFDYPITYYYLEDYTVKPRKTIYIYATLPNGEVLSAEQQTIQYKFGNVPFLRSAIPPPDTNITDIRFSSFNNYDPFYFIPKMVILYENTVQQTGIKKVEVPSYYIQKNDKQEPVYPGIIKHVDFSYQRKVLDQVMKNISGDDLFKNHYKVYDTRMSVLVLNESLAAYYSAENYVNDNFSIVVTKPEYTNINGGKGIFGSYSNVTNKVGLNPDYVEMFGYEKGR